MTLKDYLDAQGRGGQKELAVRLGISVGYLHDLMTGRRMPSVLLAYRIERATKGKVSMKSWIAPELR